MKKIVGLVAVIAIIVFGIVFIPKLVHTCDDCGKTFLGTGYEANVVAELLTEEEQIICKECAEEQHALAIFAGQSVDDFKRPLFE